VAAATVWPAPGGNLNTCAPSGPTGDAPVPRGPADTIRVRSKTVRKVFAALCSFSVPVARTREESRRLRFADRFGFQSLVTTTFLLEIPCVPS
jgi:hypothetical protein